MTGRVNIQNKLLKTGKSKFSKMEYLEDISKGFFQNLKTEKML